LLSHSDLNETIAEEDGVRLKCCRYYNTSTVFQLFYKYGFAPTVGDQDWFTVLGFQVQSPATQLYRQQCSLVAPDRQQIQAAQLTDSRAQSSAIQIAELTCSEEKSNSSVIHVAELSSSVKQKAKLSSFQLYRSQSSMTQLF
jgi:hypothetical protein